MINMQGDTLVERKDARTQSPKQKQKNKSAKKKASLRDGSTETKNKKMSKSKHYKQSAPLGNDVPFGDSKRKYNVTCPNPECIDESKTIKDKSKKISKKLKHDKAKNNATLLHTNVKLEMKAKNPMFCHGGPCSGTDRCSRPRECACRGNGKRTAVANAVKNKGNVPDSKRKQKNKVTSLVHVQKQNKNAEIEDVFAEGPNHHQKGACKDGMCAKATKTKDLSFFCRCKLRKSQAMTRENKECSDITCNASNESKPIQSNTTIGKLRKKISCLCRKYSEKLKEKRQITIANSPNNVETCNTDLCGEAYGQQNNIFKCFCKKKKIQPESNKRDSNKKQQEVCDDKCDLEKVKIDAKTSKGIIKKICQKCLSKDVKHSSKIVRQPLDTNKKTSGIQSQSGSEECQGTSLSELKKMQNPKAGLKISMNEKDTKHLRICHCRNCKRKKKRQPTEGTKTKGSKANECGDALCGKHTLKTNNSSCGVCCKCKKKVSTIAKFQNLMCASLANLMRKRKARKMEAEERAKTQNVRGKKKQVALKDSKTKGKNKKKKSGSICSCHHECQCRLALLKNKKKKKKTTKIKKKPKVDLKSLKKKKQRNKEELKGNAKFNKEVQQKERAEKKKQLKMQKQEMKELQRLSEGKEALEETSCLADFFFGIFKAAFSIVKTIAFVIFSFITRPKVSCNYFTARVKDPLGTYERIKKWFRAKWYMKKLQMAKTVGGSDTMSIFSDTIKDQAFYQAFASKGKTKGERQKIALENKRRKRRILKRHDEALYSCKHNLLTTLRKTPCLWVYHVCPGFYPQCLSMLALWKKFANLMLFCLAFAFWTPCILLCELCRGLMCCTLCME